MNCNICLYKHKNVIKCLCNTVTCYKCINEYKDIICLHCKKIFKDMDLIKIFDEEFLIKNYKKLYIENNINKKNEQQLYFYKKLKEKKMNKKYLEDNMQKIFKDFVCFCPNIKCESYILKDFEECYWCKTPVCITCQKIKEINHVCNDDDLKNIEALNKTSKKCPGCLNFIEKNYGCDIIICTYCGYKFHWLTLKKTDGVNEHYRVTENLDLQKNSINVILDLKEKTYQDLVIDNLDKGLYHFIKEINNLNNIINYKKILEYEYHVDKKINKIYIIIKKIYFLKKLRKYVLKKKQNNSTLPENFIKNLDVCLKKFYKKNFLPDSIKFCIYKNNVVLYNNFKIKNIFNLYYENFYFDIKKNVPNKFHIDFLNKNKIFIDNEINNEKRYICLNFYKIFNLSRIYIITTECFYHIWINLLEKIKIKNYEIINYFYINSYTTCSKIFIDLCTCDNSLIIFDYHNKKNTTFDKFRKSSNYYIYLCETDHGILKNQDKKLFKNMFNYKIDVLSKCYDYNNFFDLKNDDLEFLKILQNYRIFDIFTLIKQMKLDLVETVFLNFYKHKKVSEIKNIFGIGDMYDYTVYIINFKKIIKTDLILQLIDFSKKYIIFVYEFNNMDYKLLELLFNSYHFNFHIINLTKNYLVL